MKATASLKLCLLFLWIAMAISCEKGNPPMDTAGVQFITASTNPEATSRTASSDANTANDSVYICVSKGAKRYHYDESCRGLKRCTHTVEKTTKKKAEAIGLTVCGYEQ